ncbi:hypothetical protein ACIQC5_19910 [Paenarthrobacter sp. NPDC092416]|uniref:hypothetical protein n=1 Tax=Paenarthrobacter sp. NPDC092416 TaxID=3364386 RepID=UPI0037FC4081
MAGTEHARGKAPEDAGLPQEAVTDALEWMRITYALDYAAKADSWDRPEDYPQLWTARAYVSDQILELDGGTVHADAQGEIAVAEASVYVIPNVGDVNFFDTMDAHSAELCQFAEAFIAAGSDHEDLSIDGEPVIDGDLLILSWLAVQPPFRGHRVGQQVLKAILRAVGRSTGVVALRAAPGLRDGMEEGSLEHRRESRALAKYWGELGFRRLNGDFMVLADEAIFDLLEDQQQDDSEVAVEALQDVPLMQMSEQERDAVFKSLRRELDD